MKFKYYFLPALISIFIAPKIFACGCPYSGNSFKETFINYCKYASQYLKDQTVDGSFEKGADVLSFSRDLRYLLAEKDLVSYGQAFSLGESSQNAQRLNAKRKPAGDPSCTTLTVMPVDNRHSISFTLYDIERTPYVSCGVNYLDLIAIDIQGAASPIKMYRSWDQMYASDLTPGTHSDDDVYVVGSIEHFADRPMVLTEFKEKAAQWVEECNQILDEK